MSATSKVGAIKRAQKVRAKQVADAQSVYRRKMRDEGYQRLQEWMSRDTMARLKEICEILGASRRDVLERLVSDALDGHSKRERGTA